MRALLSFEPGNDVRNVDVGISRSHLWVATLTVVYLILTGIAASDGLLNLYDRWIHEEEYGYGPLVFALVLMLLWRRRHLIAASSTDTRWPGLMLVFAAQLTIVLAGLGESYYLEQVAVTFSFLGIAWVVFGTGAIRVFIPLAVLSLLTIPWPYTLQAMITIELQLLSTKLGVAIVQLVGVPVYFEGNIIDLGTYKLQVAEACSGLRYLLPLICISFIVAYLYRGPLWKRAIVVLSAIPLTIVINSLRIAATALLVTRFGTEAADGFLHACEGWVIFLLGSALLLFEIFALQGFRWSNVEFEPLIEGAGVVQPVPDRLNISVPLIMAVGVCAITLAITTSTAWMYRSMPTPTRESFATFPRQVDSWRGQPQQLDRESLDGLKPTDYYVGDFVDASNIPPVNLFVAYYGSLNRGAAIHSPRVCLPGAGWEFASFEERSFSNLATGAPGTYNYVVIQKGEQRILMYYWFQQRERRTAGEFSMKYYILLDSLHKGRKDGALVRLYTPIVGTNGETTADSRLRSFARAILSKMPAYLPE
jgi:exosortase D (VPLPA-CTERM-specific)